MDPFLDLAMDPLEEKLPALAQKPAVPQGTRVVESVTRKAAAAKRFIRAVKAMQAAHTAFYLKAELLVQFHRTESEPQAALAQRLATEAHIATAKRTMVRNRLRGFIAAAGGAEVDLSLAGVAQVILAMPVGTDVKECAVHEFWLFERCGRQMLKSQQIYLDVHEAAREARATEMELQQECEGLKAAVEAATRAARKTAEEFLAALEHASELTRKSANEASRGEPRSSLPPLSLGELGEKGIDRKGEDGVKRSK